MPLGPPLSIPPGRYAVGGVVTEISDVLPVPTPGPIRVFPICEADLNATPSTHLTIKVTFAAAGTCSIAIAAVAEADAPSARPLGVVPADLMMVSALNSTTQVVFAFVNGTFIASLDPNGCLGCGGDDGIPASILSPLPWHVEVRMPAGRVLVALDIHAGDVVYTDSGSKGDGNRVDLSCGRIDVWAGPPLLGPAPGPGTPGDCRL